MECSWITLSQMVLSLAQIMLMCYLTQIQFIPLEGEPSLDTSTL